MNAAPTWQQVEAGRTRARRAARFEALLIWNGSNPRDPENTLRLALLYRSDQAIPIATFRRWRKQSAAQKLMETELEKLAEKHGLTADSVIEKIAKLDGEMSTDMGKLAAIRMQAALVGVPVEASKGSEPKNPYGNTSSRLEEYTGLADPPPHQIVSHGDGYDDYDEELDAEFTIEDD